MKIICASSVTYGKEAFSSLGEVEIIAEGEMTAERVRHADAVITRSKTRLNRALLGKSNVKFAGTCTAGIDHANLAELQAMNIHFASAPGCNANAVSEYVLAALVDTPGFTFKGKTVGIIGHGQVGTRVDHKLRQLGCRILRNDPPKSDAGGEGPFVDLDQLVEESDVITLHVPLVEEGLYPTRELVGAGHMSAFKQGVVFINACRGEAVHTSALIQARKNGRVSKLILDVWDPEPELPAELLAAADLGTPHIAGHSVEGKVNGTRQIRQHLCEYFGLQDSGWDPTSLMPAPEVKTVSLEGMNGFENRLRTAVNACYDIRVDDRLLRASDKPMAEAFVSLRRTYRNRREFSATRLHGCREDERLMYKELGFKV